MNQLKPSYQFQQKRRQAIQPAKYIMNYISVPMTLHQLSMLLLFPHAYFISLVNRPYPGDGFPALASSSKTFYLFGTYGIYIGGSV